MSFFQVPNKLWDRTDLNVYERVVLIHIIRKTIGWGKTKDGISLSQFQKNLNISKNTILKTLNSLIKKNLIHKEKSYKLNKANNFNFYSLHPSIIQTIHTNSKLLVHDLNKDSFYNEQGIVNLMNTQNTFNTKNNKDNYLNYFIELWNEYAKKFNLSKVSTLSNKRKNKLKTRLKEQSNFAELFEKALKQIEYSTFLQGKTSQWKINFDWLIDNDTNYLKVIEGEYKDSIKNDEFPEKGL